MIKKSAMIAAAAVATMICSGVSAAPLTDYSAGKTAIDLSFRGSDIDVSGGGINNSYDKKSKLDWGITTGLGSKFALQYNGFNAKTEDKNFSNGDKEHVEVKTQEFNVLYKIDKNVSAYAGVLKVKGSISGDYTVGGPASFQAEDKSKMQFGLIGSTKIADKTTAYASFAVASDITNWKIGVSQEIAPNLDFNIDYRNMKVNNVNYGGSTADYDVTSKGIGYGVTYKF
ncbi:hypothetical protein [Pelosinus sp. UFO1]|uniref:hypothetical protein n=1 Tax=Pelosinus sp. UFO1 TaxID=484770 RepID=UPI0004D1195E|nr:hypothetical protein [Pelosinus sp. UFO1]AIF52435.1 hypothetical protein UFO1_2892 [Pelosinus sp. UFO1]